MRGLYFFCLGLIVFLLGVFVGVIIMAHQQNAGDAFVYRMQTMHDGDHHINNDTETFLFEPRMEMQVSEEKVFGFIAEITEENGKTMLIVDMAQWFEGEAAERAIFDDGTCEEESFIEGSCSPNGFYIRNNAVATTSLTVSPTATIRAAQEFGDPELSRFSVKQFVAYVEQLNAAYSPTAAPYWFTLKNGAVIDIEQQYVP